MRYTTIDDTSPIVFNYSMQQDRECDDYIWVPYLLRRPRNQGFSAVSCTFPLRSDLINCRHYRLINP